MNRGTNTPAMESIFPVQSLRRLMMTMSLSAQLLPPSRFAGFRPPNRRPIPPMHDLPIRRTTSNLFPRFQASAITSVEASPAIFSSQQIGEQTSILACPICYNPLNRSTESGLKLLLCQTCKKAFSSGEKFLDLTIINNTKEYGELKPLSTELFRSPLVSFLYERGWRQSFFWGGFPGPEKEFEMAKSFLEPTMGGTIVDASCGSGMFSRLLAKSGLYSIVIAMDFSENMLRQCYEFIEKDGLSKENIVLVRADIARLPFVSSSIDAVHAGAALHCWPSPSASVAEICRILKPGGRFVATTFVVDAVPTAGPVLRIGRRFVAQIASNHFYLSEGELEDLFTSCGLVDFQCVRNGSFIMMSASKPG